MESTAEKPKRKRLLRWYWILFFVVLLIITVLTIYKTHMQNQVQSRLDALRAAGYPVSGMDLDALYEVPPSGKNAADIYLKAFAQLEDWESQPDKRDILPIAGNAEFQRSDELFTPETIDLIEQYLADNTQTLQLLHKAVPFEACRYPVDFRDGFNALMPRTEPFRSCAQLLQLEAIYYIHNQDTEKAVQSAHAIFCLARSLKKEPILISQLVRVAVSAIFVDTVELILNHSTPSPAQIQRLKALLERIYDSDWLRQAFIAERAQFCEILNQPDLFTREDTPGFLPDLYASLGFSDQARLVYLDAMEEYLETISLPPPLRFHAAEAVEKHNDQETGMKRYFLIFVPALAGTLRIDAQHQGQQLLALTALAIENYRKDHQQLPNALADLVPEYLDELPVDSFDGKPMRYEKRTKGYCLYCIGEDLTDDHGVRFDAEGHQYTAGTDVTFIVER